jgi:NTE family protein
MAGALAAVQDRLPFPAGEAGLIMGTSAGSVLATALRCGFTAADLVEHQQEAERSVLGGLAPPGLGCAAAPPWPALWPGSPGLILRALRSPRSVPAWAIAAACLPRGQGEHRMLRAFITGVLARDHQPDAPCSCWPGGERTWITAVDYDTGRPAVFGRPGAPRVAFPDAVVASCSVPGWYRPLRIGAHRYVDGGCARAPTLICWPGQDWHMPTSWPAASLTADSPRGVLTRAERFVRRRMTGALLREVEQLRATGTQVTVLTPGPDDLAAMGGNLMDGRRRLSVLETSLRTCPAASVTMA